MARFLFFSGPAQVSHLFAEAPIRAVASPIGHEQVTPPGAALVAALATFGRPAPVSDKEEEEEFLAQARLSARPSSTRAPAPPCPCA